MNIELYKKFLKLDNHLDNIQPYYTVEKYVTGDKKNILCIDYRCKKENLWYRKLKVELPQYNFYFIYTLQDSMSNTLILNTLKDILKNTHIDIVCINFQSIMYSEYLVEKNKVYKYKICKAYNSSTNISCIFRCIFTFIRQITFVQMLSYKNNIQFFWFCDDYKLYDFIMFRFLKKLHFIGHPLPKFLFDKHNVQETKLFERFLKKIKG